MAYMFTRPQHLALEIRRVAVERLEHAAEQLSEESLAKDPVLAVHTARKDLKKTRSLMRLARGSLDPYVYRAENDQLREAAHLLAGAREADAKMEALESLIESAGPTLSSEARTEAAAWLEHLHPAGTSSDVTRAASEAAAIIARAQDAARLWALGHEGFCLIAPGILRTYRGGRQGLGRAREDPSDHTLHEWRKRVKDMWYSLRLLGPVWEPVIRPLADQAHELSEILGDHHDLGEVWVAIESGSVDLPAAREELATAVRARQEELYEAAISLGRKLYSEKPRRYVARLEGLWSAWEDDASRHVGQAGLPGS